MYLRLSGSWSQFTIKLIYYPFSGTELLRHYISSREYDVIYFRFAQGEDGGVGSGGARGGSTARGPHRYRSGRHTPSAHRRCRHSLDR